MVEMITEPRWLEPLTKAKDAYEKRFGVRPMLDYENRDVEAQIARILDAVRTGVRLPGDSLRPPQDDQ